MATGEVDLKTLLEHDFKMVQAITGTSRVIINDLEGSHHWVTHSISLFTRLKSISENITVLLDSCEPYWENQATAFAKPEAAKLWKTAAGLWSALPAEQKKFEDYAARRRRERIMGQTEDSSIEIEEEQMVSDKAAYDLVMGEMDSTCTGLLGRIAELPDGLVPQAPVEGKAAPDGEASSVESGNSQAAVAEPASPEPPAEAPAE